MITRVTLAIVPLPALRRFATVRFPDIGAGVEAVRRALDRRAAVRRAHVRRRGHAAGVLAGGRRGARRRLHGVRLRGRRRRHGGRRAGATLALASEAGAELLDPGLGQIWWDRRYDFYHPPHQPELPSIWGTIDVVATYSRIEAVYDALRAAVKVPFADTDLQLRMTSHWYAWGR